MKENNEMSTLNDENQNNTGEVLSISSMAMGDNLSQIKDIARNYYSAIRTRTPIEPPLRYDSFPAFKALPKLLEMDYSRILNKPYFIKNFEWSTTNISGFLNNLALPEALWVNPLARLPFEASTYYRAKISLILQVSGTPMHSGTLLATALPYESGNTVATIGSRINTFMAAPHVFLSANESTPVVLEVPFYVNSKLAAIDTDERTVLVGQTEGNYSDVTVYVLNPLLAPTSGSTSLTIAVHVVFRELEFYNPHITPSWTPLVPTSRSLFDFEGEGFVSSLKQFGTTTIDNVFNGIKVFSSDFLDRSKDVANMGLTKAREFIRAKTGLHAPEIPYIFNRMAVTQRQNLNLVDAPSFYEKLDPYSQFTRVCNDSIFDTTIDEMSIKEIVSKPQFLGTFAVDVVDPAGTLLWSRPITPLQDFTFTDRLQNLAVTGTPGTNYGSSLIQTLALLSKYWRGSLKIHIQSVMSNFHFCKLIIARNYSPDARMPDNYPTYEEITNLQTETLEFSAGGQVQTIELPFVSLLEQLPVTTDFEMNAWEHGMYYMYLYQPLVTNGTVPTKISFNVYISGGDDFELMGYSTLPLLSYSSFFTNPAKEAIKSGVFQAEATSAVPVNTQMDVVLQPHEHDTMPNGDFTPIVNVRDYIRRFNKVYATRLLNSELTEKEGLIVLPLSDFCKTRLRFGPTGGGATYGEYSNPLEIVSSLFLGQVGGLKFKILFNGTSVAEAWYIPPGCSVRNRKWVGTIPAIPTNSALSDIIREQYKFPDVIIDPNIVTAPKYTNPTVSLERPTYIASQPNYVMSTGGLDSATETTAMSSTILEFEVPYMSPLRFVGNGLKNVRTDIANNPALYDYTGELGHLVIKVATPYATNYTITAQHGATLEVFVAASDEFRFGYQVYAPPVGVGSVNLNQTNRQISPYALAITNATSNALYASGPSSTPACYYTKT
jgi:hypothetical protein